MLAALAHACVLPASAPVRHRGSQPAQNSFAVPIQAPVVDEAEALYDGHLRERVAAIDQVALQAEKVPCRTIDTGAGRFFLIRPSVWHSDICWISADDSTAFSLFEDWLARSTLVEQLAGAMDCRDKPILYNGYFVVRSACIGTNMHADFVDGLGTNAVTVMTPLRDFRNADSFQLAYVDDEGQPRRYTYRRGEAICFGAGFQHSTEPGAADPADGVHCYLCFTFGSDKAEYWPRVLETQGGYAARVLRGPDRTEHVTEVGRFLAEQEGAATRDAAPPVPR